MNGNAKAGPEYENDAGVQPAPGEGTQSGQDRNRNCVISLSVPCRKRLGIFFYRASRSPAEVIHCLTEALRREIRVNNEFAEPISNEILRDIVSWGDRGCLP